MVRMNRNKIIIISIVIAILIISGAIGILYATTDLFKSDKKLFYKYLSSTKVLEDDAMQVYKETTGNIRSSNYTSSGNVNFSVATNNTATDVANIQKIFDVKYNMLKNRQLNQFYSDYNITHDNQNIITIRTLKDENTYAVKADNVINNYLAVENKDLKTFLSKLGVKDVSDVPNALPLQEIWNIADRNPQLTNAIKTTYFSIIDNRLTPDKFTKTVKSSRATTLELALTEQEVMDIIQEMLETLKNDDTTIDLIIQEASNSGYTDLNVDSFKTDLQEKIDKIVSEEYSEEGIFLKIAVTENGKRTTGVEVSMMVPEETKMTEVVNVNGEPTSVNKVQATCMLDLKDKNRIILNLDNGQGKKFKSVATFGYELNKMEINIDVSTYDQNNTEVTLGKIQYQIMDYATSNIKQSLVMEIDLQNSAKMQINIDNLMTLKQDVQIEKITDQNALKLNNLTAEQLNDLKGKINERLMYLYGEKLETVLMGVVENVLSAASETPSAENATEKTTQEENDNTNQVAPENTTVPTQPQQQVTPSTMPQTPKQELRPQERTTSKKDTTSKNETQNQETTQPTQPVSQEENQETNQVSEESSTTQNEV